MTPASPLTTIDRGAIETSGYSNVGDVVRSLPQAFAGGVNPGVIGAFGTANQANASGASTVNLRGLGPDSTLTLIDGHRVAYDGFSNSVDISVIPLAALDRIEIVTDGSSAIYGSDAVGGVANFILRKDFAGVETSAHVGTSTRGGATDQQYSAVGGVNWDGGNVVGGGEYFGQDALYSDQRNFSSAAQDPTTLLPRQTKASGFVAAHQDIGDRVSLFADGFYTVRSDARVEQESPYTFFVRTTVHQLSLTAGADIKLTDSWALNISGTYSNDKDSQVQPYLYDGAPFGVFSTIYQNQMKSAEVSADGPIMQLPGGPLSLAIGAGYRSESYRDSTVDANRSIKHVYVEFDAPILTPSDALGMHKLELSGSVRYEHYTKFGDTIDPKVGLVYQPLLDVSIRSTWGKSFRAPSLIQQFGQVQSYLFPGGDYGVGGTVIELDGSNPNLKPEKATTWTAGMDLTPSFADGLKISPTYFNIDYTGRIEYPIDIYYEAFTNPSYAPFVTYAPSPALQASALASAAFFRNYSGQPYDPTNVYGLLHNQYQNAATQNISGVDLAVDDVQDTQFGLLKESLEGTWLRIKQRLTSAAPPRHPDRNDF